MTFRPRRSAAGWVSTSALLALLAVPLWLLAGPASDRPHPVFTVVISALFAVGLFFGAIYPTMRYTLSHGELTLRCGPFRWVIPVTGIRSIRECDLEYLPWSEGIKLPGYALFQIHYGDAGRVQMCATSMTTRVLLIETASGFFGITPADVDGFTAELARQGFQPALVEA